MSFWRRAVGVDVVSVHGDVGYPGIPVGVVQEQPDPPLCIDPAPKFGILVWDAEYGCRRLRGVRAVHVVVFAS